MPDCIICGKSFEPRARKLTCALACSEARAKQLRGTGTKRIACRQCGKEFSPNRSQKECSTECKQEFQRARWRKQWHDDPKRQASQQAKRKERVRTDKAYARSLNKRKYEAIKADPERLAKARQEARKHYASNAETIRAKRKQRAATLTAEEREAVLARQRLYTRRYLEQKKKPDHPCHTCGGPTPAKNKYCCRDCRRFAEQLRKSDESTETIMTGLEGAAIAGATTVYKYSIRCAHCGKEISTNNPQRKTCDSKCWTAMQPPRKKNKRQDRTLVEAICDVCQKPFQAYRRNAKTCSKECRAEAKRQYADTHYSGDPAYRARQTKLARIRKQITARCIVCGRDMTDFEDLKRNRYTCSEPCRLEAMRRKNRRAYEQRTGKRQ